MSESPVIPKTMRELPVPHPYAFFRHTENQLFLKGQRSSPILEAQSGNGPAWLLICLLLLSVVGVFVGVLMVVDITWSLARSVFGGVLATGSLLIGGYTFQYVLTRNIESRPGRVIEGRVIEAEKIRIEKNNMHFEAIGIRYEFTTPDGRSIQHRAETPNDTRSGKMAPAPETPVYVWYGDDGKVFLL